MWTYLVVAVAAGLAVGWVPVGTHFWRAWRLRGAPLSLAICGLIALQIYSNASAWLFIQNDVRWVISVLSVGNLVILSNFYLCMRWQKTRFPDARKTPPDEWRRKKKFREADTDPGTPRAKRESTQS